MEETLSNAISEYEHELQKIKEIHEDMGKQHYLYEIQGTHDAVNQLIEKAEMTSDTKDNDLSRALLLSLRLHSLTLDALYEAIDHIRIIERHLDFKQDDKIN